MLVSDLASSISSSSKNAASKVGCSGANAVAQGSSCGTPSPPDRAIAACFVKPSCLILQSQPGRWVLASWHGNVRQIADRKLKILNLSPLQFPFLVDPNIGTSMYESDDIVKYLFEKYGDGDVPLMLRLGTLTTVTCALALSPRPGKGSR